MISRICVPFNKTLYFDETNGLFNETIRFFPILSPPYVMYNGAKNDITVDIYQICGALMLLMKSFAQKYNYRIELMRPIKDIGEAIAALVENPPHFILSAVTASEHDYFQSMEDRINLTLSNMLGIKELGNIAYRIFPGEEQLFSYFKRLGLSFNLLILSCVFLISGGFSLIQNSFKICYDYIFSLFTSIFSVDSPKLLKTSRTFSMCLIGSWLISSMFIRILFLNYILDDMVSVIPIRVIDSWDDLYNRPEIEIKAASSDLMTVYTEQSTDKMAINFAKRLENHEIDDYYNKGFVNNLKSDLSSGRSALSMNRMKLIYTLIYMHISNNGADPDFLSRLHVSKNGGLNAPYFTIMPELSGSNLMPAFNKLINQVKESGIYDQWVSTTLRSDVFIDPFVDSIGDDLFKFDVLIFDQIIDVFYVLIIGYIISIFLLFGEFCNKALTNLQKTTSTTGCTTQATTNSTITITTKTTQIKTKIDRNPISTA